MEKDIESLELEINQIYEEIHELLKKDNSVKDLNMALREFSNRLWVLL